jgi:nucleotide-binding universal stress UspA family protein
MNKMFYRIVVPTDFSPNAEPAWSLAQRLAAALESELVLTHVLVEPLPWSEASLPGDEKRVVSAEHRQSAGAKLDEMVGAARADGLRARSTLRTGRPHEEIVALTLDERADLVVIGTHGRGGLSRTLLGSVADRVLRLAPCPVLTVRSQA